MTLLSWIPRRRGAHARLWWGRGWPRPLATTHKPRDPGVINTDELLAVEPDPALNPDPLTALVNTEREVAPIGEALQPPVFDRETFTEGWRRDRLADAIIKAGAEHERAGGAS